MTRHAPRRIMEAEHLVFRFYQSVEAGYPKDFVSSMAGSPLSSDNHCQMVASPITFPRRFELISKRIISLLSLRSFVILAE